jgi:hypothetical protein
MVLMGDGGAASRGIAIADWLGASCKRPHLCIRALLCFRNSLGWIPFLLQLHNECSYIMWQQVRCCCVVGDTTSKSLLRYRALVANMSFRERHLSSSVSRG